MQKCNIDPTVLYGIFESTRKNDVNDLTLGLAMYQKEHPEKNIDSGLAQEIRLFFGRGHDKTLSKAFPNLADFYIAFLYHSAGRTQCKLGRQSQCGGLV